MAVTGFWPIYKNLKATLDYADNPDKTIDRRYLDDDLYAALSYAENDNKTDRKMYVGGINCSKQNAYAEMIAVQRRFGLRGKVVGYHGIHYKFVGYLELPSLARQHNYREETRKGVAVEYVPNALPA